MVEIAGKEYKTIPGRLVMADKLKIQTHEEWCNPQDMDCGKYGDFVCNICLRAWNAARATLLQQVHEFNAETKGRKCRCADADCSPNPHHDAHYGCGARSILFRIAGEKDNFVNHGVVRTFPDDTVCSNV
jgi:hypothetical protein